MDSTESRKLVSKNPVLLYIHLRMEALFHLGLSGIFGCRELDDASSVCIAELLGIPSETWIVLMEHSGLKRRTRRVGRSFYTSIVQSFNMANQINSFFDSLA